MSEFRQAWDDFWREFTEPITEPLSRFLHWLARHLGQTDE